MTRSQLPVIGEPSSSGGRLGAAHLCEPQIIEAHGRPVSAQTDGHMKLSGCSVMARACNCEPHCKCRRGPAGEAEAASSSEGESSAEEEEVDEEALAARRAALRARSVKYECENCHELRSLPTLSAFLSATCSVHRPARACTVWLCRAQQEQEVEVLAEAPDAADEVRQCVHLHTMTSHAKPCSKPLQSWLLPLGLPGSL